MISMKITEKSKANPRTARAVACPRADGQLAHRLQYLPRHRAVARRGNAARKRVTFALRASSSGDPPSAGRQGQPAGLPAIPLYRLDRIHDMNGRTSPRWNTTFRVAYALVRLLDPLLRWTWFSGGLGITSKLIVRGRRTGRPRSVLVGLLRVGGRLYVGHPNGEVAWTANLRSAGRARIAPRPETPVDVLAVPLDDGPERDAVIVATAEQQPFPANLLYRGARRHIFREGRYFRIEPR